jgi:hypothetical protein
VNHKGNIVDASSGRIFPIWVRILYMVWLEVVLELYTPYIVVTRKKIDNIKMIADYQNDSRGPLLPPTLPPT